MPKLPRSASKEAKRERMSEEMSRFKAGEMHSGSKTGPVVKDRDQAIAIALNVSGQSKNRKKRSKSRGGRRSGRA